MLARDAPTGLPLIRHHDRLRQPESGSAGIARAPDEASPLRLAGRLGVVLLQLVLVLVLILPGFFVFHLV